MNSKQTALCERLDELGYEISNPEDYKNIDSILSITCKNGHRQTKTVQEFQKDNWECLECIKLSESKVNPKKGYLLALDAATNTTGWAVLNKNGQLVVSGYFEADKKLPLTKRINQLLDEIDRLIAEYNIKVIGIEDLQLEYNTIVFKTLAMLRGVLLYHLEYLKGMKVISAGADTWRSFSHIRGKNREEKKENTMLRAQIIYEREFEEDEADAVFLGKYIYSQIGKPEEEIEELLNFGKEVNKID